MSMHPLSRLLKECPKIRDFLNVQSDAKSPSKPFQGMQTESGEPVSVEVIMATFGVDREQAERISARELQR